MKATSLNALLKARAEKRDVALVTDLESGAEALVVDGLAEGDLALDGGLSGAVKKAMAANESRRVEENERSYFILVLSQPLRLAIIGAGHISQYLSSMAAMAGFEVTIIDPRTTYATAPRFPGAELNHDWPEEALGALGIDRRMAVVALSHDPKLDEPALATAMKSDAFYIGALGSRKTQGARRERMKEQGFSDADLDRIHGPVGLDIGALSPPEIGISIVAQIIDVLRPKKKGIAPK
ncbi:MAG: xanthine dehydrogenase [Rhodospirillales bacterium]|jgi:xanthine dehydrogenase accessory factor|nr:xanthine dehydrogenase [Rhodospirillales bacterium]MBT4007452.1 xanthine dehydrogenase [Rhodospirillales bacterium]MBT5075548.1 xanthine dehydrogenase [Rhodospirillales bacterium]MBT5112479.1 xanthine dehydrogenase [Rhodospirillales bacterium]MBT5673348.1 xanthine dehydrogenase [Rhodospirillales bacterium]